MEENKNWLEPTEVLEYDEVKGQICLQDVNNDWTEKSTNEIGVD